MGGGGEAAAGAGASCGRRSPWDRFGAAAFDPTTTRPPRLPRCSELPSCALDVTLARHAVRPVDGLYVC